MFTFTTKVIIRSDVPKKDGSCLICLQSFISKKRVVIPLHIHVHPDFWNETDQLVSYSKKLERKTVDNYNRIINDYRSRAIDISTRYWLGKRILTPGAFKRELIQEELQDDFIQFIKRNIPDLAKLRAPATVKKYWETHRKLQLFRSEFSFADINERLVTDFDLYMRKSGLGVNTRHRHHKIIKVFLNYARAQSIYIPDPYTRFKPVRAKGNRAFLTTNELNILIQLYHSNKLTAGHTRILRYFLFACATGLRISDVQIMTHDNIINDELVFIPYKSLNRAKFIRVDLTESALGYIENSEGKLFNTLTSQWTNTALQEIAKCTSIKKHITFHVARHTFATQFLISGGKVEVLKELLGHSKIETTMEYVHLVDQERKKQMMRMDKFVKEN